MSLFKIFDVSGSAMSAQSQRLNVVASNLANADSVTSSNGQAYKAKQVVFSAMQSADPAATGVKVSQVVEDATPAKLMYDPKHPLADEKGYVAMPNVNMVEEMVNMMQASRAYEAGVRAMSTLGGMAQKAITIGE